MSRTIRVDLLQRYMTPELRYSVLVKLNCPIDSEALIKACAENTDVWAEHVCEAVSRYGVPYFHTFMSNIISELSPYHDDRCQEILDVIDGWYCSSDTSPYVSKSSAELFEIQKEIAQILADRHAK